MLQIENDVEPTMQCNMSQNITKKARNIVEFANSIDADEVAHNDLPHLGLGYLPSSL